jgi:acyl carrier protein
MIGFSKSLAQEVGSRGVTVNCVAPGFIASPMTDALNEARRAAILGASRRRWARAGDRRGRWVYCQRRGRLCHGLTLARNGGMAMIEGRPGGFGLDRAPPGGGNGGTQRRRPAPQSSETHMADTLERVRKIVIEHLDADPEKVTDKASFIDDLGADSLDNVELVMAFEEEFDIEIPDDAAETIQTVGDAVTFIDGKLNA